MVRVMQQGMEVLKCRIKCNDEPPWESEPGTQTMQPGHAHIPVKGCVNILILASVGELLRTWKKMPKVNNMPTITIRTTLTSPNVNYIRWKVHGDWVTQLNYYDSMKAIISSSNHEPTALVIGCTLGTTNVKQKMKEMIHVGKDVKIREGSASPSVPQKRAEWDQMVFHIYKGVKVFSFCKRKNLLLTGGMDRIIRVWNPYMPRKPTGMLRSHTAPVSYIHISSEDSKIFSMSIDNTVKIWDLETHSCLFTASSKASGIKGEFATCLYLPGPQALCVATDSVALLKLRLRSAPEPQLVLSHQEPVVCCGYNPTFRHVVSCSEASVVKVWDLDTGRHLSEFIGDHDNAGITCLTFDSSGRRLVTGGRDGCLKIWSYNNGHCLHTLRHDEKQSEVCDCTYLEINQKKYVIAVGWDRRINMYFDAPHDFHHFWKPQPPWQDDLNHGHKEDILCVAQCPPFLLATSSYDGEIIIWNVISGHIYCKLDTSSHVDGLDHGKGPDQSVSCLTFLKTRAAKLDSVAASLMANGPGGSVTFWKLFGGAGLVADFTPSIEKTQVSCMVVTAGDALTYLADQQGFVHVYDIKDYGLQGPELQPPKNVNFWRAHVNTVTSLELIEEENILLSSSLDHTVCLWSRDGTCIGTFGQNSPWDIFTPTSWSHPRNPDEIPKDSQSMTAHPVLEGDALAGHREGQEEQNNMMEEKVPDKRKAAVLGLGTEVHSMINPGVTPEEAMDPVHSVPSACSEMNLKAEPPNIERRCDWLNAQVYESQSQRKSVIMGFYSRICTSFFQVEKIYNLPPPEDSKVEDEVQECMNKQSSFFHSRLQPALNRPCNRVPEPRWPSIYQRLRCHEIACVSVLGKKPDLSIIGSDLFDVNFRPQEEVELPRRSTDPLSEC
ncbi:WD repeat-containing protein 49-like [Dipodomys spectabilis]|uniref:WD repeat-containing protein 49-like n=1 Tax=Dipodomys spectabilis TaxID=105255 RepID=UPI001C53E99A|nr:WD repeat-containing protein 49-like [Dipodomys spectabilis]